MKYRATVSFSGHISMGVGEVREISDEYLIKDLLRAGYIVEAEGENKPKKDVPKKSKGKK